MSSMGSWISHQVSEFLARVSSYPDETSALRGGIEHAGESLEAEVAAITDGSRIVLSIGLTDKEQGESKLLIAVTEGTSTVSLGDLGPCHVITADLEDGVGTRLVVARAGNDRFSREEQSLLDNLGRTLGLVLRMLRTIDSERSALRNLEERQLLLERLVRIQGSISHRAPLQEVLDNITEGVMELLGDEFAAIRLIDPEDARYLTLASITGFNDELKRRVERTPVDQGAAGQAIAQRKLCIMERYGEAPGAIPALVEMDTMQAAMAVPLLVEGKIAGALVAGTSTPGRTYSKDEQEMLKALGESASIALTDAQTLQSMREARKTKDAFLTTVSHELKTPLTVMLGALRTVITRLDDVPRAMLDDLLGSALRRGEDLQGLIDMLLASASADLIGARQKISLPAFLAEAAIRRESPKPVSITEAPDVTFWGDAQALRQIMDILVDNAATHSPSDGEVAISAAMTPQVISITVSNEGRLPAVDHETLFAPFQRGPDVASGMGLGLYVARSLAGSLEGRVEVSSCEDKVGFSLVFPAKVIPNKPVEGKVSNGILPE